MTPRGSRRARSAAVGRDPLWYKDAILYELRVRSFYDKSGDGIGDFPGLLEKLDYLQDLGVTALWLLPFYPSPLRDDGYDISSFCDIHPDYGTLADFQLFLTEAHRRGLRVITELVLNHTSDQHPWFQAARRAPPGSPERDYYVWSDTPEKYAEARIIFKDFETSNWSWDPVARAYFWHRFYAHQPDLNFDNPSVRQALLQVVDFWLGLGVDGLRLDAVPYLYEREGTSCENLPETHAFLRELRAHVDARFQGRMLLAEANQWPEDAAAYFGKGDESHMAFHFPVMPRIFMALHMEDRFPLVDILEQTPPLLPESQWALFLRNHDELTLEMVTDEERDYMYRAYGEEQATRINLGIRRRLAPLCGNYRRNIELMNALLFSLPGTPVLYYGDEIGMGDNVFLGDRHGVRTPMQWSADKNAGFSRTNPQRLILPIITDPEYHYESINVEAQQHNPNSLLWWQKRLIALRKRFLAFGRGSIEILNPDNPRVLAFFRRWEGETILVVVNLSRFVQSCELDLSAYKGLAAIELFGGSELPAIDERPYRLTLGGRAFYWFSLESPRGGDAPATAYQPPALELGGAWETAPLGDDGEALGEVLGGYLAGRRWFAGRGRRVERIALADAIRVESLDAHLIIALVIFAEGEPERYLVPVARVAGAPAAEVARSSPHAVIAELGPDLLVDAFADPPTRRALLEALFSGSSLRGTSSWITARTFGALPIPPPDSERSGPRSLRAEPRGAALVFDEPYLLDVARRLDDGAGQGVELSRLLAARAPGAVPELRGAIEYAERGREPLPIAVLRAFVPNEGDAWSQALDAVGRYLDRALARGPTEQLHAGAGSDPVRLASAETPASVREEIGAYLDSAALLGRRTAELHLALAAGEPAFAPEPVTGQDQRSTYQSMRNLAGRCLRLLRRSRRELGPEAQGPAELLMASEPEILRRFGVVLGRRLTARRTRLIGDYHLGKVLYTGRDFVIFDLEGDRARPPSERRRKGSALRDVAGMMRSFHAAAWSALLDPSRVRAEDLEAARPWAELWWAAVSAAFLRSYLETASAGSFLPNSSDEVLALLDVFLLESGLQELWAMLEGRAERDLPTGVPAQRRTAIPLEFLAGRLAQG